MESLSAPNICANCGKEEEESNKLKKCSACLSVKYCSAACQKAHRPQHRKECKKRAAELYDEKLFKDPPPRQECPICLIPQTGDNGTEIFQSCCGKVICNGCMYNMESKGGQNLCPFCRAPPATTDEEAITRIHKLIKAGNAEAYAMLAACYANGIMGMPQDPVKVNEMSLKAGKLGYAEGYYNLGISYQNGHGMEIDEKKAKHYFELSAMNGHTSARHNLGGIEYLSGNMDRAMKHFVIAARAGFELSLKTVKRMYIDGVITKEEYANTLRAHQRRQDDTKSDARTRAKKEVSHIKSIKRGI